MVWERKFRWIGDKSKKKVHLSSFFADTIIYRELYIRQIEKPKEVSQLFKLIVDSARW